MDRLKKYELNKTKEFPMRFIGGEHYLNLQLQIYTNRITIDVITLESIPQLYKN